MRLGEGSVRTAVLAACAASVLASGCRSVPEPKHTIVSKEKGYEVREYRGYVVAEVVMPGPWREALYAGFRLLFEYIEGNNEGRDRIAMTAPVLSGRPEKIAMTAPVLQEPAAAPATRDGGAVVPGPDSPGRGHAISFIAPEGYTVETMPVPKDARIRIREVPPHRAAALRYGGWTNAGEVGEKTEMLRAALARDGWKPVSAFRSAQYNPPWTPPPFRRNEIIVEIERSAP